MGIGMVGPQRAGHSMREKTDLREGNKGSKKDDQGVALATSGILHGTRFVYHSDPDCFDYHFPPQTGPLTRHLLLHGTISLKRSDYSPLSNKPQAESRSRMFEYIE